MNDGTLTYVILFSLRSLFMGGGICSEGFTNKLDDDIQHSRQYMAHCKLRHIKSVTQAPGGKKFQTPAKFDMHRNRTGSFVVG